MAGFFLHREGASGHAANGGEENFAPEVPMADRAVQDFYAADLAWCYGCGWLHQEGFQLKTVGDGDETVTRFVPRSYHIAIPGYVYGGLIASLVDCHGTGSASAAAYRAARRDQGTGPRFPFGTASLP